METPRDKFDDLALFPCRDQFSVRSVMKSCIQVYQSRIHSDRILLIFDVESIKLLLHTSHHFYLSPEKQKKCRRCQTKNERIIWWWRVKGKVSIGMKISKTCVCIDSHFSSLSFLLTFSSSYNFMSWIHFFWNCRVMRTGKEGAKRNMEVLDVFLRFGKTGKITSKKILFPFLSLEGAFLYVS